MDVVYDVSRLSTRVLNATPNGIDWIDALLADHFLSGDQGAHALLFGFRGPRLFGPGVLPNPVPDLDLAWGRAAEPLLPRTPDWLVAALNDQSFGPVRESPNSLLRGKALKAARVARALKRYGLARGARPAAAAPAGAIYLNASHYPLELERHVAWLDERADVKPVFFIHDILPVLQPDLFWNSEPERHARRLDLLARNGAGAVVTSSVVADGLRAELGRRGRDDLPIHIAAPPVAPIFRAPVSSDGRLADIRYFVVCGTIEPRKNHLMLFEVWRRLVGRKGKDAPKLVVVGKRGWHCEEIVSAMHNPDLKGTVIEASGLSTDAYRSLLAQACALLSPTFAEGFGLPVAEALAAGVPTIVSDIPSHRELGGATPLYLDPTRMLDWYDAVEARSSIPRQISGQATAGIAGHRPVDPKRYVRDFDLFLGSLF
ncbi:MAG: glycosyltransferase [Hyphomicrobiales bacterium]|nr:glycosyltransferase [Hyphomicrobiales bacterium]